MEEIWKTIKGYENIYEVSNKGNIRSVDRYVYQQNRMVFYKGTKLKPFKNNSGYLCVGLSINNKKKKFAVHRLVAESFLPNPHNYPQINHKDENKENNEWTNLEWCTGSYNGRYGTLPKRREIKYGHRVCMYNKRGDLLNIYISARGAERELNISHSEILNCCKRNAHTAGGYVWRFLKETNGESIEPIVYKTSPRAVCQYDKKMKLINKYSSIHKAAKAVNGNPENIGACCRGIASTSNGYYWSFEDAPIPKKKNFRKIFKYNLEMELICEYDNLEEASESIGGKKKRAGIKQCLYGKNKQAYGYIWKYAKEE